ncbi:hypothetical protein Vafri_12380, partial [Volvox africanus]
SNAGPKNPPPNPYRYPPPFPASLTAPLTAPRQARASPAGLFPTSRKGAPHPRCSRDAPRWSCSAMACAASAVMSRYAGGCRPDQARQRMYRRSRKLPGRPKQFRPWRAICRSEEHGSAIRLLSEITKRLWPQGTVRTQRSISTGSVGRSTFARTLSPLSLARELTSSSQNTPPPAPITSATHLLPKGVESVLEAVHFAPIRQVIERPKLGLISTGRAVQSGSSEAAHPACSATSRAPFRPIHVCWTRDGRLPAHSSRCRCAICSP